MLNKLSEANARHSEELSKKEQESKSAREESETLKTSLNEQSKKADSELKHKLVEQEQILKKLHQSELFSQKEKLMKDRESVRKTFEQQLDQHLNQNKLLEAVAQKIKTQLEQELKRKDEILGETITKNEDLRSEIEVKAKEHRDVVNQIE